MTLLVYNWPTIKKTWAEPQAKVAPMMSSFMTGIIAPLFGQVINIGWSSIYY
jgi:hypothetical protein